MTVVGGLLLSNQPVAFIGFLAIGSLMSAIGYSRLAQARNAHDVFSALFAVGGLGLPALALWLTLTFKTASGVPLAVFWLLWICLFGALERFAAHRRTRPEGGSDRS